MHFCLENYRKELWSESNLASTGVNDGFTCTPVPIASFNTNSSTSTACVGSAISFRDNSYNAAVTSRLWDFGAGATPATSIAKDPTGIVYSTPGKKTVKLTVTGPNGSSTTTVENFLTIQDPNAYANVDYINADWDYINDYLDKGWYFDNELPATWKRTGNAYVNGNTSLVLEGNQVDYRFTYSLVSPTFNLTGAANPYLSFSYSFAANYVAGKGTQDTRDLMQLFVSYDCGKTWIQKRSLGGNPNALSTPNPLTTAGSATQSNQYYIPTKGTQWKKDGLTGSSGVGSGTQLASVKFKIAFTSWGGNNFYLDQVIVGVNSAVNDLTAQDIKFSVTPNPFNTIATINYDLLSSSDVKIALYDIVGKEVAVIHNGNQDSGPQSVTINKDELGLKTGLYFIKTKVGASTFSTKVLIN
jgi:PKD repeat protein